MHNVQTETLNVNNTRGVTGVLGAIGSILETDKEMCGMINMRQARNLSSSSNVHTISQRISFIKHL